MRTTSVQILVLAVLSVLQVLALMSLDIYSLLVYQSTEFINAELWRVVTGQLIHINPVHALLNMGVVFLLYFLSLELKVVRVYFWASLLSLVSVALYLLVSDISWYAGMSGWLYGAAIVVAWQVALKVNKLLGFLVVFMIVVKLITQYLYGANESMGFDVVREVHYVGAFAGFVFLGLAKIYRLSR